MATTKQNNSSNRARLSARDAQIVKLCKEGLSRREIAEAVGCSDKVVSSVTQREGLKLPRRSQQQLDEWRQLHSQILDLLDQGLTPAEVAEAVGCSTGAVYAHKRKAGQGVREKNAARDARIVKLHAKGMSWNAIAEAVGCGATNVGRVLQREGVDTKSRMIEQQQQLHDQIVELMSQGIDGTEIAEIVGCNRLTVYKHVKRARQEAREKRAARDARIRELQAQGLAPEEIAEAVGCGVSIVNFICK